ncbi:tRNA-dihydrouridine synthase A [Candidatus Johnevansia muelleri]|uniref:tRNA-dihydrouridine(20/20a) synthase n=1 Tax=Candidatus Johnevansia muelleri TaxID=1495769 RepID=A0A078KBA2_9GAMM|nr:tRNA-dihydrouridine synthase A [Candidatus Evansia muelleri]
MNINIFDSRRVSVAPMMGCTNRDYRVFARCLTQHALLYTEMVTTNALLYCNNLVRNRLLNYNVVEHPLALQIGGSDAGALSECAAMAESWKYDEVNLNVGCPSKRVMNNMIGVCLMANPKLVAKAIKKMREYTSLPITVKCRIGIENNPDVDLTNFVDIVSDAGCSTFIVHARKAFLNCISPKDNRNIPYLNYKTVYNLKKKYPNLYIGINGGIKTLSECHNHLCFVDSVMIGREAYKNPYFLSKIDNIFFDKLENINSRLDVIKKFRQYIVHRISEGINLNCITRHILGIFRGQPGGKKFRDLLTNNIHDKNYKLSIIIFDNAISMMREYYNECIKGGK